MKDIKEKWLLYRLKTKKDPVAFAELYDNYATRIYRFVYFKVSTIQDAEDITAEVFLKCWAYINEHREIENFGGLVYQIARNLIIDFYRQRAGKEESIDEALLDKLADSTDPKDLLADLSAVNEARAAIAALGKMKNEYREALTLRYVDELGIGEMAKILNKSQVGVRVLVHRSLKVLKKILEHPSPKT